MEVLGIGMSELVFIVIIALIVLGPRDMQKAGRTIGKFLRTIVQSDGWKVFRQTSNEIRTLPHRLMRDANDEVNKISGEMRQEMNNVVNLASGRRDTAPQQPQDSKPFGTDSPPAPPPENTIGNSNPQSQNNESDPNKDA